MMRPWMRHACSGRGFLMGVGLLLTTPAGPALAEPVPETLLLTWQRDPTTTMTIQWFDTGNPLPLAEEQGDEPLIEGYDVPRVEQAEPTPGEPEPAWLAEALHVPLLLNDQHEMPRSEAFDAELHLAWQDEGLAVHVKVRDLTPNEDEDRSRLWATDGVELFISTGVGNAERYQVILASGADPAQTGGRHRFYEHRDEHVEELDITYVTTAHEQGYTIEALLPWSNLGLDQADPGMLLGLQAIINDIDDEGEKVWIAWYPSNETSTTPGAMMPLRLAEQAYAPVDLRATLIPNDDDPDQPSVDITAAPERAGQRVEITAGNQVLNSARLAGGDKADPLARATLSVPAPPEGRRWGTLGVQLGTTLAADIEIPAEMSAQPPEPATLAYRHADEQAFTEVSSEVDRLRGWAGMFRHRLELTNLEPATRYHFRVPGIDDTFQFQTMPADASEPIRFAIGGDVRHSQPQMVQTSRVAMSYDIEFIVWGGDLAYANGNRRFLDRWEEWFQGNARSIITDEGRVIPIVVGIGNHEVQGGYMVNRDDYEPTEAFRLKYAPYFFQFFAFPGQPGYDVLDFGDYLSLIMLDTNHATPIDGEQRDWLASVLADREHVPHLFPVYHVPAYPSVREFDGKHSQQVREHWLPLFEEFDIQLAFENHDHAYKRTHPIRNGEIDPERGIVFFGDGAWGVNTREVHNVDETWYLHRAENTRHAIIVTLHGQERHVLVVSNNGDILDEYPEPASGRGE